MLVSITSFRVTSTAFSIHTVVMNPTVFDHPGETVSLHGFDEDDGPQPENRIVCYGERFWVRCYRTGFRLTEPIEQIYINGQPQFVSS